MAPSQPVLTASTLNTAAWSMAKHFKTKSAGDWTLQHYPILLCKTAQALSGCTGIGCQQPFTSLDFKTEVWALTWPLQEIHLAVFKWFLCRFHRMLRVIILAGEINLQPFCSSLADWIWLCSRIVAGPLLNQVSHFEGGEYLCSHLFCIIYF